VLRCIGEKGRDEVLAGICYWTPTEKVCDIEIHAELRKMLQEVADRNFMLVWWRSG